MISKDQVMNVLGGINDPELKKPLTDLGMVKSVEIDGANVNIGISLTVPGCPLKDKIRDDIVRLILTDHTLGGTVLTSRLVSGTYIAGLGDSSYGELVLVIQVEQLVDLNDIGSAA